MSNDTDPTPELRPVNDKPLITAQEPGPADDENPYQVPQWDDRPPDQVT